MGVLPMDVILGRIEKKHLFRLGVGIFKPVKYCLTDSFMNSFIHYAKKSLWIVIAFVFELGTSGHLFA